MLTFYDPTKSEAEEIPTENELERVVSFDTMAVLRMAASTKEYVYLPEGFEDASNALSISECPLSGVRPKAPLPVSGSNMRQMLCAYLAARGIIFYDARFCKSSQAVTKQYESGGDLIAQSLLEEFKHAISERNSSTPPGANGPFQSQTSRRLAVTLLLPQVASGRHTANTSHLYKLDALAKIAASTSKRAFSLDAAGVPQANTSERQGTPITDRVRISVVAGHRAVGSFSTSLKISDHVVFSTPLWRKRAMICVSFVFGAQIKHIPVVIDEIIPMQTVWAAITALQSTIVQAQVASDGEFLAAQGLVCQDFLDTGDLCEDDVPAGKVFLDFQAKMQLNFSKLHFTDTRMEVTPEVAQRIEVMRTTPTCTIRHVRICREATYSEFTNPNFNRKHCVGALFGSSPELCEQYILRSRCRVPRDPATRTWPIFGLDYPEEEEQRADMCVLWFSVERLHIGKQLNLFFPRLLHGKEVTDQRHCSITMVVSRMTSVEALLRNGFWILPCSQRSISPLPSPNAHAYQMAYMRMFSDTIGFLEAKNCSMALTMSAVEEPPPPDSRPPTPDDDFFSAILVREFGHPATTLEDAYALLSHYGAEDRTYAASFHNLLAAGMNSFGADASMSELMKAAAQSLTTNLASVSLNGPEEERERKRAKTPQDMTVERFPSPPPLTNDLRQESLASKLSDAASMTTEAALIAPTPLAKQDSLLHLWSGDAMSVCIGARFVGLKPFKVPTFDGLNCLLKFPLSRDAVEDVMEVIFYSYGVNMASLENDGKYWKDIMKLPALGDPPNPSDDALAAFQCIFGIYAGTMIGMGDPLAAYDTYVLFKPRSHGDCVLKRIDSTTRTHSTMLPTTTKEFFQPTATRQRILFVFFEVEVPVSEVGKVAFATELHIFRLPIE